MNERKCIGCGGVNVIKSLHQRKCIGCGQLKDRQGLIRITRRNPNGDAVINRDTKTFGRSVYLCYNNQCIEAAFKKNRLAKALRTSVPDDLKGQLLNELRTD